ncbi:c-type cytochrome [Shewanella salipaludis]|uniref:Cytochrome c n=1 Tax=Shewanella salipaludis TaxID=2723052 RepID=A0A972JK62_9GAMM|nr:cytochrome c [Shewanella salipaludis]NMH64764.1 cytochrome c [Shewanella salipaludis]
MKKRLLILIASTALTAGAQANDFKNTDAAIHYRQSAFDLIAHNFGDMGAMLKGKKAFDADTFAMRATHVAALAKIPFEGFVAGSDQGDTDALAKIWQDRADFDAKMSRFQENAAKLALVAQQGEKMAIKQAFMETGKSCKGCHDSYKKD